MAMSFDGSDDALYADFTPGGISDYPFCISALVNSDRTTGGTVAGLVPGASSNESQVCHSDDGGSVRAYSHSYKASKSGMAADTWHQNGASLEADASRYALLDGVKGSENTDSQAWSTASNRVSVGALYRSAGQYNWLSAIIAEIGFWNVVTIRYGAILRG